MNFKVGDQVELFIERETPLGYSVLINNEFEGLLYDSDIYIEIDEGDVTTGYIKKIREDGRIDVSLRPQGFLNTIDQDVEKVLSKLDESPYGYLLLTDKSPAEHIHYHLEMSKKAYKKALGKLYKQKRITITDDKVTLIKK